MLPVSTLRLKSFIDCLSGINWNVNCSNVNRNFHFVFKYLIAHFVKELQVYCVAHVLKQGQIARLAYIQVGGHCWNSLDTHTVHSHRSPPLNIYLQSGKLLYKTKDWSYKTSSNSCFINKRNDNTNSSNNCTKEMNDTTYFPQNCCTKHKGMIKQGMTIQAASNCRTHKGITI